MLPTKATCPVAGDSLRFGEQHMIRRAMQRDLSPSEISLRPRRKTGTPGEYSRDLNWNGRSLTVRRRALPSFRAERISSAGRIYALYQRTENLPRLLPG
jgi:hypothetical protein